MPRYYCDYCDTHLTHDSPSVRKQHNAGYKHKANVRSYYQQFEEQQTQSFIDQKVKEHLGQAGYPHVGAAFHQHLTTYQTGQYRPPVALPPPLPLPRSIPGAIRPPILPRPAVPAAGYGAPPGVGTPTVDMNGLTRPPGLPGASSTIPPSSFSVLTPNNSMPSTNGSYANTGPPSSANTVSYAFSGNGNQYSSQQAFAPLGPPGTSMQPEASHG